MSEKMKLFQYAAILHKKEVKDGKEVFTGAELLIAPTYELGKTDREILFKVIRQIPEDKTSEPDNVEIIIRNF